MDCGEVIEMLQAMDGRESVRLINMGSANALYACLIQGGDGRVGALAQGLGVSVKTVYAWCSNTATAPVAALRYCVETWGCRECVRELTPKPTAATQKGGKP